MRLGVLVYIEHEGNVLMIHRAKEDEHQGLWLAPGGKVEPNEAPRQAAIREVWEETGLTLNSIHLKGMITFPDEGDSPFGDEWLVFAFYANDFEGTLRSDCPEGRLQWISKDSLKELPMWEGDYLFQPKMFESQLFHASMTYHGSQLTDVEFW